MTTGRIVGFPCSLIKNMSNETRSQSATNVARNAAVHVAQARLELRRLAAGEGLTLPIRNRARNLTQTLAELVDTIERLLAEVPR